LSSSWIGDTGHATYPAVRAQLEYVGPAHAFLAIRTGRDPVGQHSSLAMADFAPAFHADARHKALRSGGVSRDFVQAIEQAEAIAESQRRNGDLCERLFEGARVADRPRS